MSVPTNPVPGESDPSALSLRQGAWTRYWATGAAHSCGTSYGDVYGGALGIFWQGVFRELQPGGRVLDIATGNGALPRLLLSLQPQPDVECDAIDLARVEPPWLARMGEPVRRRVRFHPGVAAESLPFADRSFDLVVSQYGIEYADPHRSLVEAVRVLAPHGRIVFVVHHGNSTPVKLASHEIAHIDWLCSSDGLLDAAASMIEPVARSATAAGRLSLQGDAAANLIRERFNLVQTRIDDRVEGMPCPDMLLDARRWCGDMLAIAARQGDANARTALQDIRSTLNDCRLRLDELRRHGLDDEGIEALCGQLRRAGLHAAHEPLHDGEYLLGWAVQAGPDPAMRGG